MEARLEQEQINLKYMDYVATSLQLIPQDKYITKGFMEVLNNSLAETDARTGQEIAQDVINRAGLIIEE